MICKNFTDCKIWFCQTYGICLYHYQSLPRKERAVLMGFPVIRLKNKKIPPKTGINKIKRTPSIFKEVKITEYKKALLEKTGGVCWLCGEPITFKNDFSIDHKMPKSRGGRGDFDNLFPSHKKCNSDKSNKIITSMDEFLQLFPKHK